MKYYERILAVQRQAKVAQKRVQAMRIVEAKAPDISYFSPSCKQQ